MMPASLAAESTSRTPELTGPTIRRHLLGAELRRLRLARSLRLEDAAGMLGVAPSTVSRIEAGKAPARTSYVQLMLDLYQVKDPGVRKMLASLAREGQRKGWWADFDDVLPAGMGEYLGLESAASQVCCWSVQSLPDLLATQEYAAAAWRAALPEPVAGQVARLMTMTMRRQELLHGSGQRLHAIIDEAALLRPVGSAGVMAAELEHLAALASSPSVTVRVVRLGTVLPVLRLPFTILDLGAHEAQIGCALDLRGHVTVTKRDSEVHALSDSFAALGRTALAPARSASLLRELAQRYRSGNGAKSR
jgi:transcriptional regulator with XRE-family HTH domain